MCKRQKGKERETTCRNSYTNVDGRKNEHAKKKIEEKIGICFEIKIETDNFT